MSMSGKTPESSPEVYGKKWAKTAFFACRSRKSMEDWESDFLYSVILMEEMGRTNHFGLAAFLHSDIVVPYITSYASEELKHKYLPGCISGDIITAVAMTEPNAGSDLAGMRTTAVDEGE